MLVELMLASALMATTPTPAPINTSAIFVDEVEHEDLSFLKTTAVSIMGDSISTYAGKSIEGGSSAVYPDSYITDMSQMWWADLNVQQVSAVSGSYVTHREDGEYVNFNTDTRVGHLGGTSWCIIYGGTCDLLADVSCDSFDAGLRALVSNVQYGDLRSTVLCTLPPIDHTNSYGEDYIDYNEVIRKVAKDTNSKLCEFSDAWSKSAIKTYTEDGIHPNQQGMEKLAERFD